MVRSILSEIYFVTNNVNKYMEVKPIADKYGFKIIQHSGGKLEIQSNDLMKIAKISAIHAYMDLNKPVLVEDAGLFIYSLNGFPGPYSSYVYKTIGCSGILKLLENTIDRRAKFVSAGVLIYEPFILTEVSEVEGYIADKPKGSSGFGFDPIFIPIGETRTFGEMSIEEKNKYSHRAKTVDKLFRKLRRIFDSEIYLNNEN